eukprot:2638685-Amphidinium_carterae.2
MPALRTRAVPGVSNVTNDLLATFTYPRGEEHAPLFVFLEDHPSCRAPALAVMWLLRATASVETQVLAAIFVLLCVCEC